MSRKLFALLSLLLLTALSLGACQPTVQTVEVVKEQVVTQIVQGTAVEKVITATPEPTQDTSKEPVALRFTTWTSNETQLKLLNDIAVAYTAKNPNVTVKFDSIPGDEYIQKVSIQLAGGDPPDVGWMFETAAANWIKAGALADMGPMLKANAEYNYADFTPKAMAFWVRDESVYGVPFSTSPNFVMYNKDLFEAAGIDSPDIMMEKGEWTFENFAKAAKAIQDVAPEGTYGFSTPDGGNLYIGTNPIYALTPIIRSYGGEFWSDDFKTCMMNQPEAVEAITLFQKMVAEDKSVASPGESVAFTAGKAGMAFGQISRVGPLKDATFKWGIAPMPTGPAGSVPTIGQAAVVAFSSGKNVAWAQDFVAFLTSKENVEKLAAFWPPARESVLKSDAIAKNNPAIDPAQINAAITESIINGKVVSSHPDFAKVELTFHPFIDQLWQANADVPGLMNQSCEALASYFK
jgi:multiple sugar transport system substrate-binding protein